jgi:hypothetical protein
MFKYFTKKNWFSEVKKNCFFHLAYDVEIRLMRLSGISGLIYLEAGLGFSTFDKNIVVNTMILVGSKPQ